MSAPTLNEVWAGALVRELVRGGVAHVVICPGSRSSPLAVSCAESPDLRCWSVIDERSAGFFALGIALETNLPAALVATSGTAGAHFLPAVIEASMSHVPLVVLTADRPWELQGFGAPQTIPQQALFGRFVRRFEDLPAPDPADGCLSHLRAVVARAVHTARRNPAGPVHLNVPFREPLAPSRPSDAYAKAEEGAEAYNWAPTDMAPAPGVAAQLASELKGVERGLLVCGPRPWEDGFGPAAAALSRALGWPIVAEAASNVRFGHPDDVVAHADALLQHDGFARDHVPEVILRFGGGLTSKRLQQWIDAIPSRLVLVSDQGSVFDPAHRAGRIIEANAAAVCASLSEALGGPGRADAPWRARWLEADRRVRAVYEAGLGAGAMLSEPLVAREMAARWPEGGRVFVSSSMPIREFDAYASPARGALRVFANRGANGIDGVVSSALGVSAATTAPTALLIGDLAFLHDLGGLLSARRHGLSLTVVVVNNDGGGIFSFLPIASATPHFEEFFATPHGVDLSHAATLFGARFHRPTDVAGLRAAIREGAGGGLHLIEVRVERARNPMVHRELAEKALAALSSGGAP